APGHPGGFPSPGPSACARGDRARADGLAVASGARRRMDAVLGRAGAGSGLMVRLEGLSKVFGETIAVDVVSLEVQQDELLSLLGHSGCGKTTTLRMIGGFETPTTGRILLSGKDVTGSPPQRRGTGMVFQSYALFPHLDVFENVAFG